MSFTLMVDVQISSFYKFFTAFLVSIYGHFRTTEIALMRIERIAFIATWIVLICRGVLAGSSGVVDNCSSVSDAGDVQLIAGRFTPSFDFRDDLAVFDACVLHRHDQLLMPVNLSAAGVVGNNSECAFISPFEFAQNLLERQEVRSVFLIPIRRSDVQFT